MEHGAGMRIEADPLSAVIPGRDLSEQILEQAASTGYRAALIDAADGTVTAGSRFARTVRSAASGLARRGLVPGDTAGVMVTDAVSFAIAVNAVRAAGARALSLSPDTAPAQAAARLNAAGARLLITSATLAGPAAEAADRSRVRQVIAFGDAPGTTPFSSLLGAAGQPGDAPDQAGRPRPGADTRSWPGVSPGGEFSHRDIVVVGPPCGDGAAYTALVDLTLLSGATLVAAPLPLAAAAVRVYRATAVIVPRGAPAGDVAPARVLPVAD